MSHSRAHPRCPSCFVDLPEASCAAYGWQPGRGNQPPALPLGVELDGRYRIGRVLGQGGFGITYLAWEEDLERRLAIKEYLPRESANRAPNGTELAVYTGAAGEQFAYGLERFLEEARALARFDQHPGIVSVKSFFRANGTGYSVMEYVDGMTLKQYLAVQPGGRLPFDKVLRLLMPVMDALRAVHAEGLLHRDVAPDNIYLSRDGRIKLLDFGAARQAMGAHSRSLSIILKPGYAPEEQYRSKGKQGPWTDIYSLAATAYQAITGVLPPEALDRLAGEELILPSKLGAEISENEEGVLLKALAVRGDERFETVVSLQQAWLPTNQNQEVDPVIQSKETFERSHTAGLPGNSKETPCNLISGRYCDNGDGTVTDIRTGLRWSRCCYGQTWTGTTCIGKPEHLSWDKAIQLHENESKKTDGPRWRLPTVTEMKSLIYCSNADPEKWPNNDTGCSGAYNTPTVNGIAFPNTPSTWFWTSSPDKFNGTKDHCYIVSLLTGRTSSFHKSLGYLVRLIYQEK